MEQALHHKTDLDFLKRVFGRLTSNFGWWVNRKDRFGRSLFEGGFLGLDNIGVFDRSAPLPTGGHLEQADGTAWVALFCQNMLEIAFELAAHDPTYEELAGNYAMELLLIARARAASVRAACGMRKTVSITMSFACLTAAQRGSRSARWSVCCRFVRRQRWRNGSGSGSRDWWRDLQSKCNACRSFSNRSIRLGPAILALLNAASSVSSIRIGCAGS